jgi:thioesterase domain-containing protein
MQPEEVPGLEPRAPRKVWEKYLSDLVIRRVPGSHLRMLEEGAAGTAAELSQCLDPARSW